MGKNNLSFFIPRATNPQNRITFKQKCARKKPTPDALTNNIRLHANLQTPHVHHIGEFLKINLHFLWPIATENKPAPEKDRLMHSE